MMAVNHFDFSSKRATIQGGYDRYRGILNVIRGYRTLACQEKMDYLWGP
jgi:hypothetical protein